MKYTLIWSFALGAFLAVFIFHNTKKITIKTKDSYEDKYEKWFTNNKLQRKHLTMETVKYGTNNKILLESQFLFERVSLICIVLVKKRKNAIAANNTWTKHCNDRKFVYLQSEKDHKIMLPIKQEKIGSSWHLLCDAIREISPKYKWALFVIDDLFAIPENIRHMTAALDENKGYYFGHAIAFWGTKYNIGQAGYILSKGSILAIQNLFNSSEACLRGGRFWKQEDFYLGIVFTIFILTIR